MSLDPMRGDERRPTFAPRRTSKPLAIAVLAVAVAVAVVGVTDRMGAEDGARLALSSAAAGVYAFESVSLLPMDGERVLPGQTVVVRDGVITAVGAADQVEVPPDAARIDGRGRFLMPGLAEMHAHVPQVPGGGAGWPDREALEDILFLYVANGITTIRGMLGAPYQLELRDALARGEMLGPNFYVGAPSLRNQPLEEAERLVRDNATAGYDLQKIHPGATRETWDRVVQVAREVGITLAGHVPAGVGLEHALASGMSTVDHLDGYVEAVASAEVRARLERGENVPLEELVRGVTPQRIGEIARLTVQAGTWQVPTLYLWENLRGRPDVNALLAQPEMRYVSREQRQAWRSSVENRTLPSAEVAQAHNRLRLDILKAISDAGGGILMGTDSPQLFNVPGFALHREIERMEAAGLSRFQVLESGTRAVGRYVSEDLGLAGNFGTVAAGNRADLLLLEANPLDDLSNLTRRAGVMVRGRWVPAEEIEAGLARLAAKHGATDG